MQNRQLLFSPKIQYQLTAESAEKADKLHEAASNSLRFSKMWTWKESNLRLYFMTDSLNLTCQKSVGVHGFEPWTSTL